MFVVQYDFMFTSVQRFSICALVRTACPGFATDVFIICPVSMWILFKDGISLVKTTTAKGHQKSGKDVTLAIDD